MDGYGYTDGYNNAKARRSGALLKRVALMGIRWPAMQRGAVLLLLLLPLLLAVSLLGSAALAPASRPGPAGSTGTQERHTKGHEGAAGADEGLTTGASELPPELRDLRPKRSERDEPSGTGGAGASQGGLHGNGDVPAGQRQDAAAGEAGFSRNAARRELVHREMEAHRRNRWARRRMGRREDQVGGAVGNIAGESGLVLNSDRPRDVSDSDQGRKVGDPQRQLGGGTLGSEQEASTTQGSGDASSDASGAGRKADDQRLSMEGHREASSGEQMLWRERQERVSVAFRHAWRGYKEYAFGADELLPLSKRGMDGLGSLGATVVDALDTAMLMGHADIVKDAGDWVVHTLPRKLETAGQVNLFETTIRVLGGLLTAFHLRNGSESVLAGASEAIKTRDSTFVRVPRVGPKPEEYLRVAKDLGDRLMSAFTMSPSAVPFSDVILRERRAQNAGNGASSTAECTTLQMEFWELSRLTGDPSFSEAAMKVMKHFQGLPKSDGLVPIYIDAHNGQFASQEIRLGSRGDSYYEYLIKVWLHQGQREEVHYLQEMFVESMEGVRKWLVARSLPKGLTFVAERTQGVAGPLHPKMDHLVCFLPGSLILGATKGLSVEEARRAGLMTPAAEFYVELAANLTHTCYEMYNVTATGLAPEIAYFNMGSSGGREGTTDGSWYGEDISIHAMDRHNLLRPETVEALFYMHRATRDTKYREWGWKIFQAFEQYTRVGSGGYTSLSDVTRIPPSLRDKMETFFLGETLKYFFLLFADESLLPLDKYVLNTEAHPLPVVHQASLGLDVK